MAARGKVEKREVPVWIADRNIWVTIDRETAVEEGDPRAKFLLVSEGREIPLAVAESYGVMNTLPGPEPGPPPKEDGPPTEVPG